MAGKIRRQESSSDDDNEGPGSGDDSATEDSSTTTSNSDDDAGSPTLTSPSSTSTRTPSPAGASTTQNSPTPTSIASSDIVSTGGGETIYITTNNGQTETLTINAQSTSTSLASGNSGSNGLSTGATAGVTVGVVIPALIAAVVLFFIFRRQRRTTQRKDSRSWDGKASETSNSGSQNVTAAGVNPSSGEQTLQSFGYGGTAELHNEDKAVETTGRPIYEMGGSTPEDRDTAGQLGFPTGEPPEYTPRAVTTTSDRPEVDAGPAHDVVSPLSDSATYAPGELVISPTDSKTRHF